MYKVRIVRSAEKEMSRLSAAFHDRVGKRILDLGKDPRPRGATKLSGREEYRLRVGDYRVLYVVDDRNRAVIVTAVGHRREVYE